MKIIDATISRLIQGWESTARRRFHDAEQEEDPEGKKDIERGAIIYRNCAAELKEAANCF